MTTAETIMAIIGGLGIAGTGIAWAIKVILAPLKVVIENNTAALNGMTKKLDAHDETLDDHGQRIVAIETTHKVKGCAS